jgi:hypothetical protein
MALEWEKEDERQVGLLFELEMLKTDPEEKTQVRHGQAVLKVMDAILEGLLKTWKEEDPEDDVPES